MSDANLMLGLEHPDDAGVYRVTDELALILTVDFFTPMVDDPYAFDQIAVKPSTPSRTSTPWAARAPAGHEHHRLSDRDQRT